MGEDARLPGSQIGYWTLSPSCCNLCLYLYFWVSISNSNWCLAAWISASFYYHRASVTSHSGSVLVGNVWNDSLDCEESERDRECNPLKVSTLDYLRQKKKSSLPNVPHQEPPRTPGKYKSPPSQPCGSFLHLGFADLDLPMALRKVNRWFIIPLVKFSRIVPCLLITGL